LTVSVRLAAATGMLMAKLNLKQKLQVGNSKAQPDNYQTNISALLHFTN